MKVAIERIMGAAGRRARVGAIPLMALLGGLLMTQPLQGQSPRLAAADRLLSEGRFAEARAALEVWYDAEGETAGRVDRQQAIWLRALLTTDPALAELDYRRLVIEYPGGPYSDAALLRLAQGARAWGDLEAARRYLEILVRDYPQSPLRVEARTFLARLDQAPALTSIVAAAGAPPLPDALPPAAAPLPSPAPAPSPPSPSAPAPAPSPPFSPSASPAAPVEERSQDFPSGAFTLQLGAFSTDLRAGVLAADASAAGVEVRIVKVEGSDLFRVRHGAFETREAADVRARSLRDLGFETVISSDREREIGG